MSDNYIRYAVYFMPPAGSPLARFGAAWLGWDPESGCSTNRPPGMGDTAGFVEQPAPYGFHGTLKAPFALAVDRTAENLGQAMSALGARIAPFQMPRLVPVTLDRFLVLMPSDECPSLDALAGRAVTELDEFRAMPGAAEAERRLASASTPRQRELVQRWGYPFVLDEFRFHMTLTRRLDEAEESMVRGLLAPFLGPLCADPVPVREFALCAEDQQGRYRILARYPLCG